MEINIQSEPEPRKIKTYGLVSHHFEYTQTNYKEMNRILLTSAFTNFNCETLHFKICYSNIIK